MCTDSPRFTPRGMASGIGSLPFEDPRPALALILTELPECPHWPQLPRRSRREHFVHQFLQPLVACGLRVHQNGRWFFDVSRDTSADSFTVIYSACLAAEEGDAGALMSFLPPPEAAAGFHAFMRRAHRIILDPLAPRQSRARPNRCAAGYRRPGRRPNG